MGRQFRKLRDLDRGIRAAEARTPTGSRPDPEEVHRLEHDLGYFSRQAWSVVEPFTPFVNGWHIDCITEHLQAVTNLEINNLVINIPPRHMKSLLVGVFWFCWAWAREPWTKWLFGSYADSLVKRDSDKCRLILESPWYEARWGDRVQLSTKKNTSGWFESTATGYRMATTLRGLGTGHGGDYIVVDDPMKALDARSAIERLRVVEWWTKTMSTRINDPKKTRKVVVMQRLHEGDLSGYLAGREHGYEILVLPAEYEPKRVYSLPPKPRPRDAIIETKIQREKPHTRDPRTEEGELLWPDRYGRKELDDLKVELEADGVAGQLQQRPSPADGTVFQRPHFRYARRAQTALGDTFILRLADGTEVKRVPVLRCKFLQTADTANKANQHNDPTAVGTFALTPDGDLIIYHMAAHRIELPYQLAFLKAMRRGPASWLKTEKQIIPGLPWPRPLLGQWVEDAASGSGLLQSGLAEGVVFRTLTPDKDKVQRAAPLSALYEAGRVYHMEGAPWLVSYEDEAATFPAGAHDDQVDVAAYAAHVALYDRIVRAGMAGLEGVAEEYTAPENDPGAVRRPWTVEPGETDQLPPEAEIVVALDPVDAEKPREVLRSPDRGDATGLLMQAETARIEAPPPAQEWDDVLNLR